MCIIALKPEKVLLSKSQMQIMWDNNPHGAGFMYAENGEVKVVKGLETLDALWDAVQEVGPLRKMVLHFRIRTHGGIIPELTHPFWVREKRLAMVHNGVVRALTSMTNEKQSDTAIFAKSLSKNYSDPVVALKSWFHREMMEAYIGHSKMVFMDGTGETYILNEHFGIWNQNVWYSNEKYKVQPTAPTKVEFKGKYTQEETDRMIANYHKNQQSKGDASKKSGNKKAGSPKKEQKPLLGLPNHWDRIPDEPIT